MGKSPIMTTSDIILKLIFILTISQTGHSQTNLLLDYPERIESVYYNQFSKEPIDFSNRTYEYNAKGEILLITHYHDELNGEIWKEEVFEYNNGYKTLEKIIFICDFPSCPNYTRTTTFSYQDSCLIQELLLENSSDGTIKTTKTYDSSHCQILSELYETKFGQEQFFTPFYKIEWSYVDTTIERRYYRHLITNEFRLSEIEKQYLDSTSKVSSIVTDNLTNNRKDSIKFTYEPDSAFIIQEAHFTSFEQNDFQLTKIINRKNLREPGDGFYSLTEFNEIGEITHFDSSYWRISYNDAAKLKSSEYSRTQFFIGWEEEERYSSLKEYDYDCKDRLIQTVEEDNLGQVRVQRLYYEVDEICPEIEVNNQIEEDILIYPNPAKDFIRVENELFKRKKTIVRIIDMNGVVHFQNLRNVGLNYSFIDTYAFSNGLYFVEAILNNRIVARGKFIKQ